MMSHTLPALPYAYNALEPYFDEQTMQIHHTKHHNGNTNNRNAALEGADWILFSIGPWREVLEIREKLHRPLGNPHGESTPMAAIEAASGTLIMRSMTEGIKLGSTFGRPILYRAGSPPQIEEIYFERDSARGLAGTHMWFCEEVGELTRALRRGEREKLAGEFADVLAWLCTLANISDVDLTKALEKLKLPALTRRLDWLIQGTKTPK